MRGEDSGDHVVRKFAIAAALASLVATSLVALAPASVGSGVTPRLLNPSTGLPLGELPTKGQFARARAARVSPNFIPANAHASYFGGPVVSQPSVISLLWASDTKDATQTFQPEVSGAVTPNMDTWFAHMTNSAHQSWLSEYNTPAQGGTGQTIGYGQFVRRQVLPHAATSPSTKVTDQQIQTAIASLVDTHQTPAPTFDAAGQPKTVFAVFFPHNVVIDDGTGHLSGVDFCAYHSSVRVASGAYLPYMVLPDPSDSGISFGCGPGTYFQNLQSYTSHELLETTTDPQVGQATNYAAPLAWYDNNTTFGYDNGEIADICEAANLSGTVLGTDGVNYSVSYAWSNATNECIAQGPTSVPGHVSDLLAQKNGDGSYHLTWTPPQDGGSQVLSYSLYRSAAGGVRGTLYQTLDGSRSSYDDTGATVGSLYYYTLVARNVYGIGLNSNQSPYSPPAVPEPPTDVKTTEPSAGNVKVTWSQPDSDGGSAITKWSVYRFDGANPAGVYLGDSAVDALTYTDSTAVEGATYTYAVTASNAVGEGPRSSQSSSLLILGVPGIPQNVVATQTAPGLVTVTWDAPASDGGSQLYDYIVYRSTTPGTLGQYAGTGTGAASPSFIYDQLIGGQTYYYSVVATNWWGQGQPSPQAAVSVTSTPSIPNSVSVQNAGLRSLTITWTAPTYDGGFPVTGYRVTADNGQTYCTTTELTCTLTGLTSARAYWVQVQAQNDLGWSGAASQYSPYVTGAPGPTQLGNLTDTNGLVEFTLTESVNDGGSPITHYDATIEPGSHTCSVAAVNGVGTCDVTGLKSGVQYTVTSTATNKYGTGPSSTTMILPQTVPDPPTITVTHVGGDRVTLALSEQGSDGGLNILRYDVNAMPGNVTCTIYPVNEVGSCTLGGLTTGVNYEISATAYNLDGSSASSFPIYVRPSVVPAAPRSLKATFATGHRTTVKWAAPSSNGGATITAYYVRWSSNGVKWTSWTSVRTSRVATHVGFKKGVKSYVQVRAGNTVGRGAVAQLSFKPTN